MPRFMNSSTTWNSVVLHNKAKTIIFGKTTNTFSFRHQSVRWLSNVFYIRLYFLNQHYSKMNNIIKLLILIFSISIFACNGEDEIEETPIDCTETIDLGEFLLTESSLDFWPYNSSISKVVFSDNLGNEFVGEITKYSENFATLNSEEEVDNMGTLIDCTFRSKTQFLSMRFELTELDLTIFLRLSISVTRKEVFDGIITTPLDDVLLNDRFSLGLTTPIGETNPNSQYVIIVDARNHPVAMTEYPNSETYEFHGKVFQEVYHIEDEIEEGKFNLFYNAEFGVIGVESADKSISLKYERVE